MTNPPFDLRAVVADIVRESVAEMVQVQVAQQLAPPSRAQPEVSMPAPVRAPGEAERHQVEGVRITDDRELDQFVRHLLALFENPKRRQDLRAGHLRFRLLGSPRTHADPGHRVAVRRIDKGAVTEKVVADTADRGESLQLGKRAILTPLAREKARSLGVHIEKER